MDMLTTSRAIIKRVQQQYFQEELEALESGKPVKTASWVHLAPSSSLVQSVLEANYEMHQ